LWLTNKHYLYYRSSSEGGYDEVNEAVVVVVDGGGGGNLNESGMDHHGIKACALIIPGAMYMVVPQGSVKNWPGSICLAKPKSISLT